MVSKAPEILQNQQNRFQAIFPGSDKTVSVNGTSAQSSAFSSGVNLVRVVCTIDCCLKFGASPTATASTIFLPANTVEYFGVVAGEKVAAIRTGSDTGTLYVTEAS